VTIGCLRGLVGDYSILGIPFCSLISSLAMAVHVKWHLYEAAVNFVGTVPAFFFFMIIRVFWDVTLSFFLAVCNI